MSNGDRNDVRDLRNLIRREAGNKAASIIADNCDTDIIGIAVTEKEDKISLEILK